MIFANLLAPVLLAVATSGMNQCLTDDVCVPGSTILQLQGCRITNDDLDDVAACFDTVGRSSIRRLRLRDNELTILPGDLFDGFDALEDLTLGQNNVRVLQPGTFQGTPSLISVEFRGNDIDVLPTGIFKGLTSLQVLDVSKNCLTTVAAELFDDMASLLVLELAFNKFVTLPAGVFSNLASLHTLNLESNEFTIFPAGVLDGLASVTWLSLTANPMTSVEDGAFEGTPALEFLDLRFNSFETLTSGIFAGLSSLQTMDFRGGSVATVEVDVFDDTPNLIELGFTFNEITTLPDGVFESLSSLQTLRLDHNELTVVTAGLFDGLASMTSLTMESNDLIAVEAGAFEGTPSLESLNLAANMLSDLPTGTFGGSGGNLAELRLDSNSFPAVPSVVIDELPSLQSIKLGWNNIEALPSGVFDGFASLHTLSLRYNSIASLPADFLASATALQTLLLNENQLTTLPAGLFDTSASLLTLDLESNALTSLPADVFANTLALQNLNIGNNNIPTWPTDIFDNLGSLQMLELHDNGVSTLPAGLFDGLESLSTLYLDGNGNLQCVPATTAERLGTPTGFDDTTACECPEAPICDEDGVPCDCQPGIEGYSCVGASSELIRAFSCPSVADCSSDGNCADDEVCCLTTQTCQPVLGISPSACGDPHMTGFRGQKFDFTGVDGDWYALISDLPSLHLNMRVTTPVPDLAEITYITGISLITADADGIDHSIVISVTNPHSLDSACPSAKSTCLADGALTVLVDGENALAAPGTAVLGDAVEMAAVNLPGACRSFGFEKYWERKMLEQVRFGQGRTLKSQNAADLARGDSLAKDPQGMSEWILGDPTATNMMECAAYVGNSMTTDEGLFVHQSEHASFKISTPNATVRISHGRLHQVAMRDPTDQYDLPDHLTWQMNLAVDHNDISRHATGVLGETLVPTLDANGNAIMNGMEAIRGTYESYRVAGPLDVAFAGNTVRD